MRVIIDLQSCQSGSRLGGIGRYSLALAKAMIRDKPAWEFLVVLNDNFTREANEIRAELHDVLPPSKILTFRAPLGTAALVNCEDRTRAAEGLREAFIAALNPDIVHVTSLFEGFGDDVVTSIGRDTRATPVAVTLYDLIPYHARELYFQTYRQRAHYFEKFRELQKASVLLAISQYSADEAREALPRFTGDIVNIRGGVERRFRKLKFGASWDDPRPRYRIKKRFLLYTASFDPRKNQLNLIDAFSKLHPRLRNRYQLVFVGHSSQDMFAKYLGAATQLGLREDDILFLGRVPDDDLVMLYNLCEVFVFPPKWEGLGLPVLEAMACGAPAIGSESTAVSEVIGRPDALFDPNDVESIASKLSQVLDDNGFRAELVAHGLEHVKQYTWSQSSAKANAAIEHATKMSRQLSICSSLSKHDDNSDAWVGIEHFSHPEALLERDLKRVGECAAANEFSSSKNVPGRPTRQGWITTWATKCGIAVYSEGLLDSGLFHPVVLAPYVDQKVRHDDDNVVRCWRQGKDDPLLDLEREIDIANLDEIVVQFNYGFFEFEALSRLLLRQIWNGKKVFIFLHSTTDPDADPTSRLVLLAAALAQCCVVFVHSAHDVDRLAQLGVSGNVVLVPHYSPPGEVPLDFSSSPLKKLATYGFFLPGKGLMEIVEALDIMLRSGADVSLRMVNAEYSSEQLSAALIEEVRQKVEALGLSNRVEMFTEFLKPEESLHLLRDADVIVFPYQRTGESSSAAVRVGIASGRPVAVTPLPIFENVSGAVYEMPGCSPAQLADGLRAWGDIVRSDAPQLQGRQESAQLWRNAHSLQEVAGFMAREMNVRGATEEWRLEIDSRREEVPLINGRRQADEIHADKKGVVCFGPYAALAAGRYRIILSGQLIGVTASGQVAVTTHYGSVTHGACALIDLGDDILADILLQVTEPLDGVEVLITLGDHSQLKLNGYKIYRRTR